MNRGEYLKGRYNKKLKQTKSTGKPSDVFSFLIVKEIEEKPTAKPLITRVNKKLLAREELEQLELTGAKDRKTTRRIRKLQTRLGMFRRKKKNKIVKNKKKIRDTRIPKKYHIYIKSSFWEKRKNLFWKTNTKQCRRCRTKRFIQLHHTYYDNTLFGNEPDEHFCPLCLDCHADFHAKFGSKKDMRDDTHNFVTRTGNCA